MRGANLSLDTKKCARRRRCSPASRHRSSGPYKGARRAAPATYRWAPLARWPTVRSYAARVRALACASFRQLKEPPKASTSRGSGEPRGALNKQTITRADLQHAPTRARARWPIDGDGDAKASAPMFAHCLLAPEERATRPTATREAPQRAGNSSRLPGDYLAAAAGPDQLEAGRPLRTCERLRPQLAWRRAHAGQQEPVAPLTARHAPLSGLVISARLGRQPPAAGRRRLAHCAPASRPGARRDTPAAAAAAAEAEAASGSPSSGASRRGERID